MDLFSSLADKAKDIVGDDNIKKAIISQIKGNADNVAAAVQTLFGGKFSVPQDIVDKIKGMDEKTISDLIDKAPSIKSLDDLTGFFQKK